ncbi:hypothetical protein IHQ56_18130, partial [Methylobacillus flagellatus]|uniref:hypothetical protein n=1 Tax=Methylobacillus flagellatus TaxID=405 RepID=UPI002853EA4A
DDPAVKGYVLVSGVDSRGTPSTWQIQPASVPTRLYVYDTLTIMDGGRVIANAATTDLDSVVRISGQNANGTQSLLSLRDELIPSGTFVIEDGGKVVAEAVQLRNPGNQLRVVGSSANGASSTLEVRERMSILPGSGGSGRSSQLLIEDGGRLVSAEAGLREGSITVSGTDPAGNPSLLESPLLLIDSSEEVNLLIKGGGKVVSEQAYVSQNYSSTSAVTVEGRDAEGEASLWDIGPRLDVGFSGSGTVTLRDGGTIAGTRVALGSRQNGSGTLVIGAAANDAPVDPGELNVAQLAFGAGQARLVFNHTAENYE